jgi:hypothetical protein
VCLTSLFSRSIFLLLFVMLSSPLLSFAAPAPGTSVADSTSSTTALQSDAAATQAMQNVLMQSGGETTWREIRSVEETFSVLKAGETEPHVLVLLDDWSLDTLRYRRRVQGQNRPPNDHNGSSSYSAQIGISSVAVPEFDQARGLTGRLPAAAAEIMLRRSEYVLKISPLQQCKSDDICVDVFRVQGTTQPLVPEQQWKISMTTGLPRTIRYQTTTIGRGTAPVWREVYFLQYATEEGLIVPVSIEMNLQGKHQAWTFVSLKKNSGFDIAKFDQEVAR